MNLKLAFGLFSGALTFGGGVGAYFLVKSNQKSTKNLETNSFKSRFPKLRILPGTASDADVTTWKAKIEILKNKFKGDNGEVYKKRLVESMTKNGISQDLIREYIDISFERIQQSYPEARILALYCNKTWNSDYQEVKDMEDVLQELCAVPES